MTYERLKRWLDRYGRAWQERDPDAAAGLFAENATYQETPFAQPMRGQAAIREYWFQITRSQEQIHFEYEALALAGNVGFAHWCASFSRSAPPAMVKLDGIFVLTFDPDGHCQSLREWWQRREQKPGPS